MAERATDAGRVHAFEPLTRNIRALEENIALSRATNTRGLPFALGRVDESAILYVPDDVGRSALAPESAAMSARACACAGSTTSGPSRAGRALDS